LIHYRADWVLPISGAPIRGGCFAIDGDRIAGVSASPPRGARPTDLGSVAVLPGLVNAHTHLELSYLRGQIPPAGSFMEWIRGIIGTRRRYPDPRAPEILGGVHAGIAEAAGAGTAIVGDITNTLVTSAPLVRSALAAQVFYEVIRFNTPDPEGVVAQAMTALQQTAHGDRVRASLAAHAPYSVAPAVFRAIRAAVEREPRRPYCVHLAESPEEIEFIRTGNGPWRAMLEELGSWDPSWTAPAATPVEYLDRIGFLGRDVIAVHGVQMTDADLRMLAARGATLVTCPRSNVHTGAGAPPIQRFYDAGVRVAIGTDSLASVEDLNVFGELAAMRRLAAGVAASQLLASATRHGAEALGFGGDYGTIERGRRARLIAVDLPPSCRDVEEYLVNGVAPGQIHWLKADGL